MGNHPHDKTAPRTDAGLGRRELLLSGGSLLAASALSGPGANRQAHAQQAQFQQAPAPTLRPGQRPNILVIMGDDVGWFNLGCYHRGMMSGKTPNLDRLAQQ